MSDINEPLGQLIRELLREELAKALAEMRPSGLVSPADYAAAQGISVKTVRRAITDGRLPAKKIGRSVRIPADATIGMPVKVGAKESDADYARRVLRVVGGRR